MIANDEVNWLENLLLIHLPLFLLIVLAITFLIFATAAIVIAVNA